MPIPAGSRYVAMGSSFAAGPGLPSRVPGSPRRAGRSTGNYAHLVARELGLDLHDVTFSGATTSDLLGPSAAGQAAQLDAVTPETSLVTITAGGNDVGFVPRLTLASLPWPLRILPPVKARVESLGQTRATDQRFEQLERNLAAATRAAAGTAGWTYVAASAASADHHAWSAEPWTRRFHLSPRGGAPYHPNATGMAAVAGLVVAALRPGTSTDPEVH
jgi:lysophospholipase L1-like esterase